MTLFSWRDERSWKWNLPFSSAFFVAACIYFVVVSHGHESEFLWVLAYRKNIQGGFFVMSGSHENNLGDQVVEFISWRSLTWNASTRMDPGGWLSREWYFREAWSVSGFSWELDVTDYFHDGFTYFRDYFRLSRNFKILVVIAADRNCKLTFSWSVNLVPQLSNISVSYSSENSTKTSWVISTDNTYWLNFV